MQLTKACDFLVRDQAQRHCMEYGFRRGYWHGVLAACNEIMTGATQHDVRLWLFREVKEWMQALQDGECTVEPPPSCVKGRSFDESTLHTRSPTPTPSGKRCFVYAVGDGHGNTKIGVAKDITARIGQLQTGNASRLYLIAYADLEDRYEADRVESWCHCELSEWRKCGEWFSVFDDVAVETLMECLDALSISARVIERENRVY